MKKFYNIGLIRGIVFQLVGTLIGAGFVTAIRALMGLPYWAVDDVTFGFTEPAWVLGGLVGVMFFLYGTRVLDGWLLWAKGEEPPAHHADEPGWQKYFGPSLDHKVIGVQYTITSLILLSVGGLFALIFRTELAASNIQFLDPDLYNTLMSLHGILMIVSILLGIAGVMNYLVPLLIGAADMTFPRLNAFSFWVAPPAAILLLSSLALGGFDTGWTGYPPLSARAPVGMQMFFLGVFVAGWSSILGCAQPDCHRAASAGKRHDRLPAADLRLGRLSDLDHQPDRHPADRFVFPDGDAPAPLRDGLFRCHPRRQPDLIPALVLVLLASGGVRLCAPRLRDHF